ncbi:hypothetical protein G6F65_014510 [Rhizopus arrhizus]|nr:hypothetical protein G6F65_014510 [Rhizopus arrhizus]
MAHAAQHHHAQDRDRFHQREALRADKALHRREQRARHTAERSAHRERQQLDVAGVDAHRLGGDLGFTNGFPRAADTRILQAHAHHDDDERQREQQVVVLLGPGEADAEEAFRAPEREFAHLEGVDAVDALRPVGDVARGVQIVQENADDFPDAQGHNGQVVPSQLERGRPQQHAEQARHRQRDRQDRPERQVQPEGRRGQQGPGIGAHRVERDVAQIQQAGKAHHDVQAQAQHHVDQHQRGDVDRAASREERPDNGNRQQQ